jgi:hypothetical protein
VDWGAGEESVEWACCAEHDLDFLADSELVTLLNRVVSDLDFT